MCSHLHFKYSIVYHSVLKLDQTGWLEGLLEYLLLLFVISLLRLLIFVFLCACVCIFHIVECKVDQTGWLEGFLGPQFEESEV